MSYRTVCSCLVPVGDAAGRHVVTIEGLNVEGLSPVQRAIVERGATQCGFCTPGVVIAATGYLLEADTFDEREALSAVAGNLCRCTGYVTIRDAVRDIAAALDPQLPPPGAGRIDAFVERGALPIHFRRAPTVLGELAAEPISDGTGGPYTIPVAGATDLLVQRAADLARSELSFLSRLPELRGVRIDGDRCLIGAATTMADLARSPEMNRVAPGLDRHLDLVCSAPIRNRATLAGNVVNASPIGDMTICLLALGADVRLAAGDAHRTLPLRDLFRGYKDLDLSPDEIVQRFDLPLPGPGSRFNFEKVCRRRHLDIASVNSAVCLQERDGAIERIRLSAGGVAPIPLLLERTCDFLAGRKVETETVRRAAEIAMSEVTPIDDVRGSARYKRLLLGRLVIAHFVELFPATIGPEVLR